MYIIIKHINIEISNKKNLFFFFTNLLKHLVKMIIKLYKTHSGMFVNTANNNVSLFCVNYFNERVFYLIFFTMLRSKRGLCEKRLEIYRSFSPAEDSVEVDSKE